MRLRFDSRQFRIRRATLVISGNDWSVLDIAVESDLSAEFEPPGPGEYIVMLDDVEGADREGGATRAILSLTIGIIGIAARDLESGVKEVPVPAHGSVTVRVLNLSGTPQSGVHVSVGAGPVECTFEAETAPSGEAHFWLPVGRYRAAGGTVGSAEVEIRTNEDRVVVFRASV